MKNIMKLVLVSGMILTAGNMFGFASMRRAATKTSSAVSRHLPNGKSLGNASDKLIAQLGRFRLEQIFGKCFPFLQPSVTPVVDNSIPAQAERALRKARFKEASDEPLKFSNPLTGLTAKLSGYSVPKLRNPFNTEKTKAYLGEKADTAVAFLGSFRAETFLGKCFPFLQPKVKPLTAEEAKKARQAEITAKRLATMARNKARREAEKARQAAGYVVRTTEV